ASFDYPMAAVASVIFSPDGKTLASGSGVWDDKSKRVHGEIVLWDVGSGTRKAALPGHRAWVWSVRFSPDGRTLASVGGARRQRPEINLWDVATQQVRAALPGIAAEIQSVAFSPDGKTLAAPSRGNTIKLWEVATGQEKATLRGHTGRVCAVAFADDSLLAS